MGSTWSSAASSAELFSVVSVVCGALDSSLSAAYASWFTPNINVDPINIEAVPTENCLLYTSDAADDMQRVDVSG